MSGSERDSLMKRPLAELFLRLNLAEAVLADGIRELAGETAIREVIRQRDVIKQTIKDRTSRKKEKPKGIVIQMKTIPVHLRKH